MLRQRRPRLWVGALLVGLAATILLLKLFPGMARHPGAYLNATGDGIKNYYVAAYYARYDSGQQFTGMNYPRGEHINYPDMQPLLAVPLAWAREAGLPLAAHSIGFINFGMLLALVLAAVVLYLVLRRLPLPAWYAGLGALLITFMAPQIARFQAHMSLSYACIVPVQWYCILRILAAPRLARWYIVLGVFNLLVGLLAAYHLGIGSLWLLAFVPVLGWQQGWRRSAPLLARLAATALVPMAVFWVWLKLTDPITDRPPNPWGLLIARSSFTGVFSPSDAPMQQVWRYFFPSTDPAWEGSTYVGTVGVLVLVCSALLALRYLAHGRWRSVLRPHLPAPLRAGLWAATLLLLFAMAYPFYIPGLRDFVWLLGPLKQFRALGRFAWPFYYVFATYAAYYIYRLWRYLRQHQAPAFALSWLAPLLLLWAAEGYWHIQPVAAAIEANPGAEAFVGEEGNYRQLLSWTSYRPESFQAILPLPYFSIGTDKIAIDGTDAAHYQAFKASLNLHLPLLTTFMSRSSVSETLRLTQLLSSPLIAKDLLAKLPSNKPILLVVTAGLNPAEQRLVSLAHLIKATPEVSLYELPLAALAATSVAAERAKAAALLPTLTAHDGLYTTTASGVLLLPFDQRPDRRGRLAPGAFYEPREKFSTLYDGPLPMPADTGRYEASVWVNATTAYGLGNLQVKLYHDTEELEHQVADARVTTEIQGDWVRVAVLFHRPPTANRLEVLYDGHDLLADDLLVRPLHTDVYWRTAQGQLVLNGYPLGQ
ncbi:hypothetical protein [Hymenobacter baengnokdamensis]|uniref:hypothetical protein n=1 Tax=Hymenobacter baengnokdamensis TaxID=2615203 RepID=UPI0012459FB2|nr:hypothetical protein [Hymenobacter baengnokdamensis]